MNKIGFDEVGVSIEEIRRKRGAAKRESSLPAWGVSAAVFLSWTLLMVLEAKDDYFNRGATTLILGGIGNWLLSFGLLAATYGRPKNSDYKNVWWAIPIFVCALISMATIYVAVKQFWPEPKPGESYFMW